MTGVFIGHTHTQGWGRPGPGIFLSLDQATRQWSGFPGRETVDCDVTATDLSVRKVARVAMPNLIEMPCAGPLERCQPV